MKKIKSFSKMKKALMASFFSLILVFGVVGSASARPMFGSSDNCNESTCENFGYKLCQKTTYIFWIGFKSEWEPQPC